MKHGVKKDSAVSALQSNPVDQVFRMAADMSRCFTSPRSLVNVPPPAPAPDSSSPSLSAGAAGGSSVSLDLDELGQKLQEIGLSDDASILADMSARLRRGGITALKDLQGLSRAELQEEVSALNLGRVQLNKLFNAVSSL